MITRRGLLHGALAAAALPALRPPGARAATPPPEMEAVLEAERYLNGIDTLQARFVQISSNGNFAAGEVFVRRPGRLRFEYDPPVPIVMIADGVNLLYYDKELKQATFVPLWETPLWFLIREKVDLQNLSVSEVTRETGTVRMTVAEKDAPETGRVTLVFSDRPFALRRWKVTDAQGITTQVTLQDAQLGRDLPDDIFDTSELDPYGFRGGSSGD